MCFSKPTWLIPKSQTWLFDSVKYTIILSVGASALVLDMVHTGSSTCKILVLTSHH